MTKQIPGITRFVHGRNCSPEGLAGEFTHMFIMTFEGAAARDTSLPHGAPAGGARPRASCLGCICSEC